MWHDQGINVLNWRVLLSNFLFCPETEKQQRLFIWSKLPTYRTNWSNQSSNVLRCWRFFRLLHSTNSPKIFHFTLHNTTKATYSNVSLQCFTAEGKYRWHCGCVKLVNALVAKCIYICPFLVPNVEVVSLVWTIGVSTISYWF